MTKVAWPQTYFGISNQAPWRKQPGAAADQLNMRNAIDKGATSRNGTDLVAWLSQIPASLDIDDIAFFSFRGDIIFCWSGGMLIFNGETGAQKTILDNTGGFPYFSSATSRLSFRFSAYQNSILILNNEVDAETENSPDFSVVDTVDFFADLPTIAAVGSHYKVRFNQGTAQRGYYRRVSTDLDWEKIPAPNQLNAAWDETTMPHRLLLEADGSYVFDVFDYASRKSGDDLTNPPPDWIGSKLEGMAFWYSRLFLGAEGIVAGSSTRDRSLFFNYDADVPSDPSNPINQALSNAQAGRILWMNQVGNDMLLICEKNQLIFTSGRLQLTNVNAQDASIASYKPLEIPPAFDSSSCVILDSFNVAREFGVNQNGFVGPLSDLNTQSLKLFQNLTVYGLWRFGGQTYFNTSNGVYVHELYSTPQGTFQSAWTRFDFNSQDSTANQVYFMDEQQGYISIIIKNETNGFALLRYIHGEEVARSVDDTNPIQYDIAATLDFRQYLTGTFIQDRNVTQFAYASDENPDIILRSQDGIERTPTVITPLYVEVHGYHVDEHVVGVKYPQKLDFERFYAGTSNYRSVMKSITVYFKDTMTFSINTYDLSSGDALDEYEYKTARLGRDPFDTSTIRTGDITHPIMQDAKDIRVRIQKSGSTPMTISALSFDVQYSDPMGVS